MLKMFVIATLAAACLAPAPLAQAAPQAGSEPAPATKPVVKERKICRSEATTGSLVRKRRICMTRAEWDAVTRTAQGNLETMQRPGYSCGAQAPGVC